MKSKKAIKIIKNQISKLSLKDNRDEIWLIETKTYLSNFFGENSDQVDYLNNFTFIHRSFKFDVAESDKIKDITRFLNDCISIISNIGIHKKPIDNWFAKLPNWLMSLIFTALFGIGIIVGNVTNDHQNFELRQKNKELNKKLQLTLYDTISQMIKTE